MGWGMSDNTPTEIFLACVPGLEHLLCQEATDAGFDTPRVVPGGVLTTGDRTEAMRANLVLRGASRVLLRIGGFPVFHLAQLDKRSHKFPWAETLRPDLAVRVEVDCKRSKIYHAGAAAQRIKTAITETTGAQIAQDAPVLVRARIEDNFCTFSVDTSGEPLHRRGHKEAVGKAPLRETLAALFLRACEYRGDVPIVDPMCGSGTFILEAAEIAAGLFPGRSRAFAFQDLAGFDPATWATLKDHTPQRRPKIRFHGSDRDAGAVRMASANAERSGVAAYCDFSCAPISDLNPPEGPKGIVMVNPPYGARIGNKKLLFALYGALGQTLKTRFRGWRLGMVTSEPSLARATGLNFAETSPPVPLGGLKIKLYQTGPIA